VGECYRDFYILVEEQELTQMLMFAYTALDTASELLHDFPVFIQEVEQRACARCFEIHLLGGGKPTKGDL
jgi:hypothetical protein